MAALRIVGLVLVGVLMLALNARLRLRGWGWWPRLAASIALGVVLYVPLFAVLDA